MSKFKFVRIEIDGNKTYLRYCRGDILAFARVRTEKRQPWQGSNLSRAFAALRAEIYGLRQEKRDADKLAQKESGAVFQLFRQKRKNNAPQAFESKSPATRTRHVGVEIEFISESDRDDIAVDLAVAGVEKYVQLKSDGSVHGENDSSDCDGLCRDNCECSDCGEYHYCDDETACHRRSRNSGSPDTWEYREDCQDCLEAESIDNCDCGGQDSHGSPVCNGEHIVCSGHCPGHHCAGSDDHPDYDCNCECTCGSGDTGHEIAIVAKSSEIADVLKRVCHVLSQHDAYVNKTCGLHVHIDMRGYKDVPQAFANLVKAQRLLYSMVPKTRYTNSYCKPNDSLKMKGYFGRYWGINPQSFEEHKTIEVRLHSGTVNAVKIINWIRLLQKIAYAKRIRQVETLSDLTKSVRLPADLLQYVKERIEKFSGDHGSYSLPVTSENPSQSRLSA